MRRMSQGNPFKGVIKWWKAQELLEPALRKAKRVSIPKRSRWIERKKELTIKKIKVLADELIKRIRTLVKSYPSLDSIHKFYRSIMEVWSSVSEVKEILDTIWSSQFTIRRVSGNYIKKIDRVEATSKKERKETVQELQELQNAAYGRICSIVKDIDDQISELAKITRKLTTIPDYNPQLPAIVVAGPPNSGKSSLVKKVSNARVETASYPFTTKDISFGHFDLRINEFISLRAQIVDSPGLFDRPLKERKEPEILALQAVRHLGDAIIILLDSSLINPLEAHEQKAIYNTIRFFFKKEDYLVALNKIDIANEEMLTTLEDFFSRKEEEYIKISLKQEKNLDLLFEKLSTFFQDSRFLREKPQYFQEGV